MYDKVFYHGKGIREILVSTLTAISVGIIIYQLVYNPTKIIELEVYIFDSIVTAILIINFYLRMKEFKEKNVFYSKTFV